MNSVLKSTTGNLWEFEPECGHGLVAGIPTFRPSRPHCFTVLQILTFEAELTRVRPFLHAIVSITDQRKTDIIRALSHLWCSGGDASELQTGALRTEPHKDRKLSAAEAVEIKVPKRRQPARPLPTTRINILRSSEQFGQPSQCALIVGHKFLYALGCEFVRKIAHQRTALL